MRLAELNPQFLTYVIHHNEPVTIVDADGRCHEILRDREYHHYVDDLAIAQGIMFLCPKCFAKKQESEGVHSVLCWFRDRNVPDVATPGPARWAVSGDGYGNLTLAPSIALIGGCAWHGWINSSEVTSC